MDNNNNKLNEKDVSIMTDYYTTYLKEENSKLRTQLGEAHNKIGSLEYIIEFLKNKVNEEEIYWYEK